MTWHDYAVEVLRIFSDADCEGSLLWHRNDLEFRSFPIIFQANCSDLFGWAIADGQDINRDDLELLLDTYVDLKEIGEEMFLAELYSARKRDRRPFDLWIKKNVRYGSSLWDLFMKLPDKGAM